MAGAVQFARALRERRRELGLSRTRLAERAGLDPLDIAQWERGRELPPLDTLHVLAGAVGLDESETRQYADAAIAVDLTGPEVIVDIEPDVSPAPNPFADRTKLIRSNPSLRDRVLARIDELRLGSPAKPQQLPKVPGIIPDVKREGHDPAKRVYTTQPTATTPSEERAFYRTRRIATAAVLVVFLFVLRWAVPALVEGVGDFIDLFTGPSEPTTTTFLTG